MSKNKRYPCSDCGSSDGVMIDPSDGHTFCFACGSYNKKREGMIDESDANRNTDAKSQTSVSDIDNYPSLALTTRQISKEVVQYFGVKTHQYMNKPAHFYPYGDDCYKIRILPKEFRILGNQGHGISQLFGQREFNAGGKMLVITEGEIDALSVAQASFETNGGKIWPVVSVPSANQLKLLLDHRSWIRSFQTVVLWFDTDEAGQKAIQQAAKIIGFDKTKVVSCNDKDANDLLMKDGVRAVNNAIWNASAYNPAGIVSGEPIWEQYIERQNTESIPYPQCLNGLNDKLKGIRHGEITLFTSGTGSGKSTVIKEIILELLRTQEHKIGLVSLEESIGDTAEKFIAMELKQPISQVKTDTQLKHERSAFERVFKSEKLVLLDHQGSVGDSSLIDKIEYMALMGCKYIVLDHITIAVSEGSEGLAGNEAVDKVMSDLLKLVKKHNVWLGLISHLRKSGGKAFEEGNMASIDDVKGSGSIKQISFDIIAFSRNLIAETEEERNKIKFTVLKSRFTGLTGPAGKAKYDRDTGRLIEDVTEFNVVNLR